MGRPAMNRFAFSDTLLCQFSPQSKQLRFQGNKDALCSADVSRHGCPEHATTLYHAPFCLNVPQSVCWLGREYLSGHRSANYVGLLSKILKLTFKK